MSTGAQEDAYWTKAVEELHHNALTNVRTVAGKWQTGLTAALGGFATLGFLWGPDKLEKFPIGPGIWRGVSLLVLGAAGSTGLVAMVYASLAAIGIPARYKQLTGPELEHWTQTRAGDALKQLKRAMILAAIAGVLIVGLSAWVLIAAATKAPASTAVKAIVVSAAGAQCGELNVDDAMLKLKIGDVVTPIEGNAAVTVVAACPADS